jgi:hypothetical protein
MPGKKSFVLRLDEDMFKAVEKWAADEFRSVNGQIEWIISQKLREAGRMRQPRPVSADDKDKGKGKDN